MGFFFLIKQINAVYFHFRKEIRKITCNIYVTVSKPERETEEEEEN